MFFSALLLQYIALFGWVQIGQFSFLGGQKTTRAVWIGLLLISMWMMGIALGWQAGIPIWLGTVTLWGLFNVFWKTMNWPPYKASAILWGVLLIGALMSMGFES